MRSNRLSCEWTILRRDLTRFAPIWIGLGVLLLLMGATLVPDSYHKHDTNYYSSEFMYITGLFGPICALSVFGYLTDPRECCAVHSLPIRREGLFLIHCFAACLMYLVPVGIFLAVTHSCFNQGFWLLLLLAALDFLVQFSLAVLCMMLTGRKIGAWLLFIFFQSANLMVNYAVSTMYLPLLPGVVRMDFGSVLFTPIMLVPALETEELSIGSSYWMSVLAILVVILIHLGLSLFLYRRRRSEFAGDLLAVPKLHPVFAVCSGLTGMLAFDLFFSMNPDLNAPMILLGMAFGYFAYWMLSAKSARIFTLKRLVGFALLAAVTIGSFFVTEMDPLGLVQRVPAVDQIQSVTLSPRFYVEEYTAETPDQIEAIRQLHRTFLDTMNSETSRTETVCVEYRLRNGSTVQREYDVPEGAPTEETIWYLSQPRALFGEDEPNLDHLEIRFDHRTVAVATPAEQAELMEILLAEAREGKMFTFDYKYETQWDILWYDADGNKHYTTIPNTARQTVVWLAEHYNWTN